MKGDGCRKVMRQLLPDAAVIETTRRGKPLGYISKTDGRRHSLSDGLKRALREMIEAGETSVPVRVCPWW